MATEVVEAMSGTESARIGRLLHRLSNCDLCPRECRIDRTRGERGACNQTATVRVSSANLHFGEEPPISGTRGSGTIFLTGCSLKCVYCQNYPISQMHNGQEISPLTLVDMMLALQERGAHNINFVTPTHFSAQIADAITTARHKGLTVPIVYNTSGYDRVDVLQELSGLIEIYMPDMRYADSQAADCYSSAPDYPEVNRRAVAEMQRQVGELTFDEDGVAVRGLLIRHLVLPNGLAQTAETFKFIAEQISRRTYISVMSQYFPAYRAQEFPLISRRLRPAEYEQARRLLEEYDLVNGWMQDETL